MSTKTFVVEHGPRSLEEWTRHHAQSSARRVVAALSAVSRRDLLEAATAVGLGLLASSSPALADTCSKPSRTPIEGPYYLGDPEEKYETGKGLTVKGKVLDAVTCQPIAGAVLVRWHANAYGIYEEYYRASMPIKADGAFEFTTIPPGKYANLDRHIHWYLTAPGYTPLLAQLQWTDAVTIPPSETFDFSLTR